VRELTRSVMTHLMERLLEGLKLSTTTRKMTTSLSSFRDLSLARRGWINQCHFGVAKFFYHALSTGLLTSSADSHLVRMLVFLLLGRLEQGGESMAAVLFSQDVLFQANSDPLLQQQEAAPNSNSSSSQISSMFLGKVCGSDRARKQLDHSFKLQHGFGITADGFGPFSLDSLLSDADQPGPKSLSSAVDLVLPLGELWLWQSLSGSIRVKEEALTAKGTAEAANVVSAVLGLLLELEEGGGEGLLIMDDETTTCRRGSYAARIPLGTKLYYLMNVCLHPETVLRDDRVLVAAEAVLDKYWLRLENDESSIFEFCKACLEHTNPAKKGRAASKTENGGDDDEEEEDELDEKDQKLLDMFHPDTKNDNISLSSEEMRSLEAFLDDLCLAYNDYGAQYDFFTKCMRLFLLPMFPSSIQCRAIGELKGFFHLLTLPVELEDRQEMTTLLSHSLSGGLSETDGSKRDPSNLLDAVASILVQGRTSRAVHGYMLNYAVALLSRNLAMSLSGSGLEASKKRLLRLDTETVALICEVTSTFLASGGTKQALVNASISATSSKTTDTLGSTVEEEYLEARLTEIAREVTSSTE
jgi:hypothetical protein